MPDVNWNDLQFSPDVAESHHQGLDPWEVAGKTAVKAVRNTVMVPIGIGKAFADTIKDPFRGKLPGETVGHEIIQDIKEGQARALVEGAPFWYPGRGIVQDIKQGWEQNDADKLSEGLGSVVGVAALEAARVVPQSGLGNKVAGGLRNSAAKNFENIFKPFARDAEGQAKVPTIKRTAQRMAESPERIIGNEEGVDIHLRNFVNKYGQQSGTARVQRPLVDADPIRQKIVDAMNKDVYYQDFPKKTVSSPKGKEMYEQFLKEFDNAVGGAPGTNKRMISEEALDSLKDRYFERAKGKSSILKTNPTHDVAEEAYWERKLAQHASRPLQTTNAAATEAETNFNTFKNAQTLFQEASNRRFLDKAQGGIGLPVATSSTGNFKLVVPSGIKEMFGGIRWNTISAESKKALARSLENGNWKKTITQLQLLKLGVPVKDE